MAIDMFSSSYHSSSALFTFILKTASAHFLIFLLVHTEVEVLFTIRLYLFFFFKKITLGLHGI